MKNFCLKTDIYFGKDSLKKLEEIQEKKVLIICDKFMETSGMVNLLKERLNKCEVEVFSEIIPDPSVEIVALGVKKLKGFSGDIIIGFGGGSSIDGAKAIREYYQKLENNKEMLFYAIPTTSGTGSEVTEYAVITNKEEGLKYALTNKNLLPDVAILDGDLVKSVPPHITADTGLDVITHAIEAYVSTNGNDFTDALAEKSFSLVFSNLKKVYLDGSNLQLREKIHNSSCMAGMAFNCAGLGITHSLAHGLGGKLHIPHGKANGIILPYVMKFNSEIGNSYSRENFTETAKKYQRLAKLVDLNASTPIIGVNNLIKSICQLKKELSIPETLLDLGIDLVEFEKVKESIIESALKDVCTKTNPRKVTREELEKLLDEISGKQLFKTL
ncbi:Alcohol dehydrogenase, class IV [Cetobacterium ceti]|uniref:Alcohol dehydrogenase, class IV n=1 Tax=Cetobacterium ceti TaxID=180163 RepID=A0A1T4NKC6_9FUSO|nr:1-propanol dehydrogenase PduQ [Cetobacterium ceti]SJZ79593.1 Alcohol dehydrogenase, class IV [Cetobacterium ceti]